MSNPGTLFEDPKLKSAANSHRADRILTEGHSTSMELERAIRELNVALQLVPSNIQNHMNLAETYCRAYDWSSAVFSLRFVLHSNAKHEKALTELCRVYCLLGKEMLLLKLYEEAVAHFKHAVKYDPTFVEGWTLMAKCFVYLGDLKSAIEAAGRAISLAGATNAELYVFRAKLYWAIGLEAPGNTDMRRAMDMNKDHPEVLGFLDRSFQRAQIFYEQGMEKLEAGDNTGAIDSMNQALQLSRSDIKLYLAMAKIYRLVGELDKALFTLQDAADIYKSRNAEDNPPEEADSLAPTESDSDSGSDDGSGPDEEESINDNDSKLEAPPKKPAAPEIPPLILKQMNLVYNDMALRLAEQGEYAKAINLLHKVITSERERAAYQSSEPLDYRYFMNRGDCYRAQGENFYASADYHSALEINPGAWEIRTKLSLIHYQTAVNYFNVSNFEAATNELNEAIRLNNRVCEYYLLRGRTNYYQGFYHDSCEDFKSAKLLDPDSPAVVEYLSLFGHGVLEEAEGEMKSRLSGSQSAQGPLRPIRKKKVLSKTESLDRLRITYKKKKNKLESLTTVHIVRSTPKQEPETGEPKGIAVFNRSLPPLHSGPLGSTNEPTSVPAPKRLVGGSPTPLIPDHMLGAMFAASRVNTESFKKVLGGKVDFISKDPSWSLIDTAKKDADALLNAETKKTREDERRREKARKQGATTVTSLKKRSMEITRQSLLNKTGVLAGVVSRADDPELVALESIRAMERAARRSKKRAAEAGAAASAAAGDSQRGHDDASTAEDSLCASSLSSRGNY